MNTLCSELFLHLHFKNLFNMYRSSIPTFTVAYKLGCPLHACTFPLSPPSTLKHMLNWKWWNSFEELAKTVKKHLMNLHLAELHSWLVIYFMTLSESDYMTWNDRMIVNLKQFERKQSWSIWDSILAFVWRVWGNPQKPLVKTASVLAEIRTDHLWNTGLERLCYTILLSKTLKINGNKHRR